MYLKLNYVYLAILIKKNQKNDWVHSGRNCHGKIPLKVFKIKSYCSTSLKVIRNFSVESGGNRRNWATEIDWLMGRWNFEISPLYNGKCDLIDPKSRIIFSKF